VNVSTAKKLSASTVSPVVVRLPKKVIAALDKAANKNCRSRSSEVRIRLMDSLSQKGQA
jgi:metal-responsive CopG/Arc/MetJ family transcriptional regulator